MIGRECAPFRGLLLNRFICTPPPLSEMNISLGSYYVFVLTQKCHGKMGFEKISACFMRLLCESRYAFGISVGLTIFILNCSMGYFFCSIFTWNYFQLLRCIYSITPFYSDLTQKLVQDACYESSCIYFYSFHDHAIPSLFQLFLRSSYLLVLYMWICSIRLSYDIDNSTTLILRFALDRRTISGRSFWVIIMPST